MIPFSISRVLLASVILGLLGLYATVVKNGNEQGDTAIYVSPAIKSLTQAEPLTIEIVVESTTAVNAFSGTVLFDPSVLSVAAIDYNTSIADLWVEEPWYSSGDGTIHFAGGTTKPGGFSGTGTLIVVTFTPQRETSTLVRLSDAHVYVHDGFGTEASLRDSVDALFSIAALENQATTVGNAKTGAVVLTPSEVDFDLNTDGMITFSDASIMMLKLFGSNLRYDFNQDGEVDRDDLSLLLAARSE